ncbi:hypothetical protein P171DRAFT_516107 [Karstenula rhodostoma CBS 690.94]|uniref:Uncharacterized protein n=1 Tax=Karstenula rhodostoma CBS 690.94 TaxID=1392251 RepID=A0A9P4UIC4_9PLEO|nr:hypothetical protein P171DRAFT_516107 [Karstenula rhodostoma CBS 690.94]
MYKMSAAGNTILQPRRSQADIKAIMAITNLVHLNRQGRIPTAHQLARSLDRTFCRLCNVWFRSDNLGRHKKTKGHDKAIRQAAEAARLTTGLHIILPPKTAPAANVLETDLRAVDSSAPAKAPAVEALEGEQSGEVVPMVGTASANADSGMAHIQTWLDAVAEAGSPTADASIMEVTPDVTFETTSIVKVPTGEQLEADVPAPSPSSPKVTETARRSFATDAARKTVASKGGISKPKSLKAVKSPRKKSVVVFTEEEDEQILHGYFQQIPEKETAKTMQGKSASAIKARIQVIAGLKWVPGGDTQTEVYYRILKQYHDV